MTAFLIVVAVLVVIIAFILSISATFTVIYDKGWHTKVKVLFIEKDIVLSKLISFILFPDKKGRDAAENRNAAKKNKKAVNDNSPDDKKTVSEPVADDKSVSKSAAGKNNTEVNATQKKNENAEKAKPNPIKKMWDEEGIVGIMSFASNLVQTANSAIVTLFRGLHIYSLYVMIIVGGPDADMIARSYGTVCKYYYPIKGAILNGMKVDNYDDYIQPDFIADKTDFEFQFIGSVSVGLLLRAVVKAGIVFLKNFLANNKKGDR